MSKRELNYAAELINWMWKRGYKCYIEKGTGSNIINEKEKTVILDYNSEDFVSQGERAKKIVKQLLIKKQLQAAKS